MYRWAAVLTLLFGLLVVAHAASAATSTVVLAVAEEAVVTFDPAQVTAPADD